MMAILVNRNGKLAVAWGKHLSWEKPELRQNFTVSDLPAEEYPDLLGKETGDFTGNVCRVRHVYVDTSGWITDIEITPVKPPRNGREYTWVWGCGKWQRDWFSRCGECREYHDPTFPYCEVCGRCHRSKGKCR